MKSRLVFVIAACVLGAACARGAASQSTYPTKPVRVLVGFGPSGAADVLARIVGQRLSDVWNQPVVIDNRPGGSSTIAAETAARSRPDGYTLLMITSSHAISAGMYKKLSYDPVNSFVAITPVASASLVLVANTSSPVRSVGDLIAAAKANPANITFGSSGTASITHLAGELLKTRAGVDILHVPYKAMSQLMGDLLGGNIQLAFTSIPAAIGQVKAGRVRAIGITSAKRSSSLPDVRTIAESGIPGYDVANWYGLLAPAGVPRALVEKLHADIVKIVQAPDAADAITKQGAEPETSSPDAFQSYIAAEVAKWSKVVKASGVQPD